MLILVTNNLLVASVLLLIRNSQKKNRPPRLIMNLSIDFRLLLATFYRKGMKNYKFFMGTSN